MPRKLLKGLVIASHDDRNANRLQVAEGCATLDIATTSRLYEVETDYYDWPLQQRAFRVLAPSKDHMCKSVVMENRAYSEALGLSDGEEEQSGKFIFINLLSQMYILASFVL